MTDTITTAVQSEVSALAHRHLTLTYGLVATLVLLVGLMGVGGYLGVRAFDAQLARAERQEQQYQQDRNQWQALLTQHDAERTSQALQIQQLQDQIKQRDSKPLPKPVQDALQPKATVQQAIGGLGATYGSTSALGQSQPSPDGQNLSVSVLGAQEAITTKVEEDKAKADLKDTQAIVGLQDQSIGTLKTDLKGCQDTVGEANKTIAQYKKLAVKSRWKKFLGGAKTVLLMAGSAYIGHKF